MNNACDTSIHKCLISKRYRSFSFLYKFFSAVTTSFWRHCSALTAFDKSFPYSNTECLFSMHSYISLSHKLQQNQSLHLFEPQCDKHHSLRRWLPLSLPALNSIHINHSLDEYFRFTLAATWKYFCLTFFAEFCLYNMTYKSSILCSMRFVDDQ